MRILIFGGFLGSGKTTVINKVIHALDAQGCKIAVIENEIGDVGIDDAMVSKAGVEVTPLFGGCVCCEISGSLLDAVRQIGQEVNPDWLIVEMTGLALMTSIRDVFLKYQDAQDIHMVSVVDMARFEVIITAMRPVLERQVTGADVVVVNKVDVAPATPDAIQQLQQVSGGAECVALSAAQLSNDALWEQISAAMERSGHHAE